MKKALGVFVLGIFLLSFSMNFVAAQAGPVEAVQGVVSGVYELIRPVLEGIIGEASTAEFFLAKVMFLIIIFAIIYKVLEKIPFFNSASWVLWLVSIAVSVLSIRWFGDAEIVRTVILPYSVLGISLTALIPFAIFFFMTEFGDSHKFARKLSWIFFIVVFIGLWITRAGNAAVTGGPVGNFAYIYLVTAVLGWISYMMDDKIQKERSKAKLEKIHSVTKRKIARGLYKQMDEATKDYGDDARGGANYTSIFDSSLKGTKGYNHDMDTYREKISQLESGK